MICKTKGEHCYNVLQNDQELKKYAWQWKHYLLFLLLIQSKDILSYQNVYESMNSFKENIETSEIKSAIVHFFKKMPKMKRI